MIDGAIECHEQVVELLQDADRRQIQSDVTFQKINFTVLQEEGQYSLLATSLQSLGKFYVEKGSIEDAMESYQEALSILRKLHGSANESTIDQRQQEITQILQALTDMFMQTHSETKDVAQLERTALVQEDLENFEKALQCWERVLYCQSQDHGAESLQVGVALAKIARVMILEGNLEGSMDLYHAAANIFLKNKTELPDDVFSEILNLYKELNQVPGAIGWLRNILSRTVQREEQAKIQFELGKLYLEQGLFHAAADSLCLSAELYDGKEDRVYELLQKVEFLQSQANFHGPPDVTNLGRTSLAAITEDGESALAYEEDFSIDDALKSLNATMTDESTDDIHGVVTIDSLVEKAKAMEGERLDALVNSTTHALVTSNSLTLKTPEKSNVVSDVSTSLTSSDVSPQKLAEDCALTVDLQETVDQGDEAQDEPREADSDSSMVDVEDDSQQHLHEHTLATDDASKSTEKTEPSISSSPGGISEQQRKPSELYSAPAVLPNFVSDDSADGESDSSKEQMGKDDAETSDLDTTDKDDVYESFHRDHDSASETHESLVDQFLQTDEAPSPMISTSSRTGLLNPTAKPRVPHKSLNVPQLSSPRNSKGKGRKGYTEVTEKQPTQRRRIVKALANPFRRSRSKSRSATGRELDPLHEDKEVRSSMPATKTPKSATDEETICTNVDAPVSYIAMRGRSDDDDDDAESLVSQITFRMEEPTTKKTEKDGQWWWGVTAEGLEGWFPSSYVHQAVEAAEGFLSAKAIHDRVKSRPFDFDSDEESEVENPEDEEFSLLKDGSSKQSKSNSKGDPSKPPTLSSQSRKVSTGSSAGRPPSGSGSLNVATAEGNRTLSCEQKIEDKKLHLETLKTLHGPEHESVAAALYELAEICNKNGNCNEAVQYCEEAIVIQKATMDLSDACKSLHFVADIHSKGTRYKEALSCYSEAQRLQQAIYGYFHEETANSLNRIGNVLARQGEFDLAMENHKEALRILKECCGENVKHPLVSQTLIQIGAVYYKERNSLATIQSKYDGYTTFIEGGMLEIIGRAHEDRGSYRMAIAFFEEKLQFLNDGENSSDLEDVAETLNSLGMLSCRAGLYLEAIDYYDRALGIQMKLGCDDVQLAMAKVLAGSVQYSLGHFNKALDLFQDALDTLCEKVGVEQETVAATLFHMGVVRGAMCNYDEAMSNLQDALELQTKLLGLEHPATFRTRREIGNLYAIYEAELDAAFEEFDDVIEAQKQTHGEKHPNVAETLHSIGCAQAKKGDSQTALRTLEQCYNMRLEFLGTDHPQQATTLHEIAKIQLKRNRLKKALHIVECALSIRVESLSEQHIDVALAMSTKASCLVARGSFAEASKLFTEALPIAIASVGEKHPSVASIHVQRGVMHLRMCDFEEASLSIQTALDIYTEADLDDDHPGIKEANEELERVKRAEMLCV
ncbi:MAG: hypothetical protein SGILL_003617 [Bacillariaceae sp.]